MKSKPLHVTEDEFVIYCSRRHPLARLKLYSRCRSRQRAMGLRRTQLIAYSIASPLEERGLPQPKVALTSLLPELRMRTVAATGLLSHSSRALVEDASKRLALLILRIEGWEALRRSAAIVYRKGAYLSPATRRLIDLVKSAVGTEH